VFHKLANPALYNIIPESPEHLFALTEVAKEVAAMLSPACQHLNIVRLIGVVVDARRRPIKLLFERADCGDLEACVLSGCTEAATGPSLGGWDPTGPNPPFSPFTALTFCSPHPTLLHPHTPRTCMRFLTRTMT
jgi:hypothetical protein